MPDSATGTSREHPTPPGVGRAHQFPEAEVCDIAVAKLRAEGWRVSCEIWHHGRPLDAVALRGSQILVLEAKVGLTKKLKHQIYWGRAGADLAIAAVRTMPRNEGIEWCRRARIGLWLVRAGAVVELVAPAPSDADVRRCLGSAMTSVRKRLIESATKIGAESSGGRPCLAGIGNAQEVQRRVDAYLVHHPGATWRDIHQNVPNHYNTSANMYSALRSNRERLAFRERRKDRQRLNVENGDGAQGAKELYE